MVPDACGGGRKTDFFNREYTRMNTNCFRIYSDLLKNNSYSCPLAFIRGRKIDSVKISSDRLLFRIFATGGGKCFLSGNISESYFFRTMKTKYQQNIGDFRKEHAAGAALRVLRVIFSVPAQRTRRRRRTACSFPEIASNHYDLKCP